MAKFTIVLEGNQFEEPHTRQAVAKKVNVLCRELAQSGYHVTSEVVNFDVGGKPQPEGLKQTYPIHAGGGWYTLSNGEKVQGKEAAEEAEAALAS